MLELKKLPEPQLGIGAHKPVGGGISPYHVEGVEASRIPEAPGLIRSPAHVNHLGQARLLIGRTVDGSTYKTMKEHLVSYIPSALLAGSKRDKGIVRRHGVSATGR